MILISNFCIGQRVEIESELEETYAWLIYWLVGWYLWKLILVIV